MTEMASSSGHWDQTFENQAFKSFQDFDAALKMYEREHFCVFRVKSSETVQTSNKRRKYQIPAEVLYSRVQYVCTHFGQPRPRGKGVKSKTKHSATGCEVTFTLQYDDRADVLCIKNAKMEHNHPTTSTTYEQEFKVKRLTPEEKKTLKDIIVHLEPRNETFLQMINSRFKKNFTLRELRGLKHQLKRSASKDDVSDLIRSVEEIEKYGNVKVHVSSNEGQEPLIDVIAFSTHELIQCYKEHPEIIYLDDTYKKNKCGYPLYQIMVGDENGRGRCVFYAFIRLQTATMLSEMMAMFVELVGEVSNTKVAITGTDHNEINAIKEHIQNIDHLLCNSHVHKAMCNKIRKLKLAQEIKNTLQNLSFQSIMASDESDFNCYIDKLANVDQKYMRYFKDNWLGSVDKWALHKRLNRSNFLNDTHNKCEDESRQLKEILLCTGNARMSTTMTRLFNHAIMQCKDYCHAVNRDTLSSYIFRGTRTDCANLYEAFMPYAVQLMVKEHQSFDSFIITKESENSYSVKDNEGLLFKVRGETLECSCPFFQQTTLPCVHCVAIMVKFSLSPRFLYTQSNRWLKHTIIIPDTSPNPSQANVNVDNEIMLEESRHPFKIIPEESRHPFKIIPEESRHPFKIMPEESRHPLKIMPEGSRLPFTKAVLDRLGSSLKSCTINQCMQRLTLLQRIIDSWESGKDVSISIIKNEVNVTDEVAVIEAGSVVVDKHPEELDTGVIKAEGSGILEAGGVARFTNYNSNEIVSLAIKDLKEMKVSLPNVRKRSRPREDKTKPSKKSRKGQVNNASKNLLTLMI